MKSVYVVGGDPAVIEMFRGMGWGPSPLVWDADLVCFTGGEDVSPELYGQQNTGQSYTNPRRDEREVEIYNAFLGHRPFVGICRGGQFLNVMNGGTMIQHIGPFSGDTVCLDTDGHAHVVRVDHHQGIVRDREKSYSILAKDIGEPLGLTYACFYPITRSLCFQPHPEWGHEGTRKLFFQLIEEYIT